MKTCNLLLVVLLLSLAVLVGGCVKSPVAGLTADKIKAAVDATIQFTSKSTGEITSWAWDFGDGNTSTQENPSHAYTQKATYTVSLTVANKAGSDTATMSITVLEPVVADFSVLETRVKIGSSIQFVDECSGDVDSWSWDFGDGSTSTEQSPFHAYHAYNDSGTYTVSLTASNALSSDTREKKDYITVTGFVINRMEMRSEFATLGEYTVKPFHVGDSTWVCLEMAGFEYRETDDQYEIWLQWRELKLYDPDGGLMGVLSDITELHETFSTKVTDVWLNVNIGELKETNPLGEYRVEVRVEDKLSGEMASVSTTFVLE
jgi:chitodextrinase